MCGSISQIWSVVCLLSNFQNPVLAVVLSGHKKKQISTVTQRFNQATIKHYRVDHEVSPPCPKGYWEITLRNQLHRFSPRVRNKLHRR